MKLHDRNGNLLSDGNYVQVKLPSGETFDGYIARVNEGGISKGDSGEVTKPSLIVGMEFTVDPNSIPKGKDARIREITRIIDPEAEKLLTRGLRPA
jgi:hypothetical protein